MRFPDRLTAGRVLAERLKKFSQDPQGMVLAIPRGGVEVGAAIAQSLQLPLEVVIAKKIGAPSNPEFAIGSVNMRGQVQLDPVHSAEVDAGYLESEIPRLKQAIQAKSKLLRGVKPFPQLTGKHVILVDDGIATGATMKAAIDFVRSEFPDLLILAVPVAPLGTQAAFDPWCDEVVILNEEIDFQSVGQFYDHFPQVTDEQAKKLLEQF